ncbi:MAG: DeoR family transcriptional regulator [Bdellovibrionota bacterium]
MFLSGDYSRALNALSSAKRALRPGVDHLLEVETMGLEFKLFSNLYMKKECEVLFPKLQKLSKKFGNTYQIRFLNRDENKIASSAVRAGEDLLGDLYDQIRAEPENAINSILKTDYHAFLYDLLPLSREASVIYLDLEPGTLTLFQRGNVNHTDGLTPQLRKIILCLSEGKEMDKEELITRVWGYKYDPLRHDNIVYSAMTLLRKLLGEKSSWLVTTESGYKWLAGVEIKSHLTNEAQNIEAIIPKKLDVNFNTLNFRQMKILQFLKNNESIDVQKCKKLFNVSDITASRDLSSLTRSNSLIRVGKGRAIRYVLVDNRLFGGNS